MKPFNLAAALLVLSTLAVPAPDVHAAPSKSGCRVCNVPIKIDMERSEVEKIVAASLGTESTYSVYRSDFKGGIVAYRDGKWILSVTYSSGTPAPWVINAQGIGEHYPPQQERVTKFEVIKAR